jgi:hypothetical protein
MAGAAVWASVTGLVTYLNDPTVQSYLQVLDVPKSVYIAIAVLGLVTYVAAEKNNA